MECFNCHKKFDYEKYYGICPKCGCFNKKESQQESHEELHERLGDDACYMGEVCGQPQTSPSFQNAQSQPDGHEKIYQRETQKRSGSGGLIFSIIFLILSLIVLVSGALFFFAAESGETEGMGEELQIWSHDAGESFAFQQGFLQITEVRKLADQESLPKLEEGMQLIAVHVTAQGDGEYEDYNRILPPYIETDGLYRCALSSYDFEPYAQMLGVYPVLDEYALMGEYSCDGWYGFVTEENTEELRICFDEYDGSDWDGGRLLASHCVELKIAEPAAEEGGQADEQ